LNGRVTGSSSRALIVGNSDGIGLALTRRLLGDGWTVAGLSRSPSPLTHERYSHDVVDVTAPEFANTVAAAAKSGVDLCVYAAGIGQVLDLDNMAAQTRVFDVNLMGAARTIEAVVPGMVAAKRGHIIGLSSLADTTILAETPSYAASKAGMSVYLQSLTLALRKHNVQVTTVRFGFVDTKMAQAPSRPMIITTEQATDVLMKAIRRRPAIVSHPKPISAAVRVLRAISAIQVRSGRTKG
jgi:NAD(P)-dependent dehydrogenase (short-subunit alcohol dehydrogenase family)